MEFFKKQTNIDFVGLRTPAFIFSLLLIAASIGSMAVRGFNFSIDFTGGALLQMTYPGPVELEPVRALLEDQGYAGAVVQHFGNTSDLLIRMQIEDEGSVMQVREDVLHILQSETPEVVMRRGEYVGPQVGEQLTNQGIQAALFALLGILIYVSMRFQWKLSVGAVAALAHDSIIALGLISFFRMPFDLTVLAAVLTLIGYSLNDTVVVYDRIRENFRLMRSDNVVSITNESINQTLARTVMTGVTTLLVLTALFYFGGETFYSFTLALIFGIIVGTYSTIFIATPVSLMMGLTREDLLPLKEKQPIDDMP